jgi:peroxiredoxin
MKQTATIFLLLMGIINFNANAQTNDTASHGYIVKVGDIAPDFETVLHDSTTFKLSDNRGKIVMLQFTASWCGVCRKEMPFIEDEIWQKLKNKDFILIGIDRDEPIEKVKEFIDQTKITYPLALDPGSNIFSKYALKEAGVTRNVIINRNGKIIYLTRLFNREEFDAMKKIIFDESEKK